MDLSPDCTVDVTDKENPVTLSRTFYDNDGYSHQGWLTPDQGTFLHGDELDELFGEVEETTIRIWACGCWTPTRQPRAS